MIHAKSNAQQAARDNKSCQVAIVAVLWLASVSGMAASYQTGDIFAAVSNGDVQWYRADGTFVQTLDTGSAGYTTGMAFDGSGNLYVTAFSASKLAKFDNTGSLLNSDYAAGLSIPESIVFDQSGNFYVGNLGNGIRKYNAAGVFQGTVIGDRVDWFDLSADQSKFIYGQEGSEVKTVSNALPGVAGAVFASGLENVFAMRYLADGGVLVADKSNVKRYNAAGILTATYDVAGEDTWFSLNLNPDGNSFWSGNFGSGKAYEFNLDGTLTQTLDTGVGSTRLYGLVIYGEKTEGGPPPPGVPDGGSTAILLGMGLVGAGLLRRRS